MNYQTKIQAQPAAKIQVEEWKKAEKTVVFTNGCFDILHRGHVDYLQTARNCGDFLVVGLNSDASVRRLKGKNRPINEESARAAVLAALACVDMVVIFEEDTPFQLIQKLLPNMLVKGGDWPLDQIVGKDIVEQNGGSVRTISFTAGYSTTSAIEKILAVYGN